MNKKELTELIDRFDDEQEVIILTEHGQTILQSVAEREPWHGPSKLIGLVCHTQNVEVFICDNCGKMEKCEWSDDVAQREFEQMFPNEKDEPIATVCDECFEKIRPDRN